MKYPTWRVVFDRKKSATKEKEALVQIEVLFERKKKYLSTGVRVTSEQWTDKTKVRNRTDSIELNERIDNMIRDINEFCNSLQRKHEEFSFEKLDVHLNTANGDDSFLSFMEMRIKQRNVSESTKKRAMCVLRLLREFDVIHSFSDVDTKAIKMWDDFAKKKCNKVSAVYNYHKHLKTYIREAVALDLIKKNPYDSIRLDKGETDDRRYLSPNELKAIEECVIEEPTVERARDVFVFSCYTGIAPVDLKRFDFTEIEEVNGKFRIRDYRQKTGTIYNITLLSKAMEILRKYDFVLPITCDQKYNIYLKAVGALAKIKKPITGYVARHTFATTVTLANGVPIEIVSKMLGHKNIQTTQIYAKVLAKNVDDAFDELEEKLK